MLNVIVEDTLDNRSFCKRNELELLRHTVAYSINNSMNMVSERVHIWKEFFWDH